LTEADAQRDTALDAAEEDGPARAAALLRERDRSARFACVCEAEAGLFESYDDCVTKTGYNQGLIDCLSAAFAPFDSPALREQLACELHRETVRSACLETATCTDSTTTACPDMLPQCQMADPQVLTSILLSCPGAAVLGR
jgi:hypothetical protein